MRDVTSAYIEKRLIEWAKWARQKGRGIGYPKRSIEGRLRDDGGILPRKRYQPEILEHPDAEEMEKLVFLLGECFPVQAEVIRAEYLDNTPILIKAKRMCIERNRYALYRDLGKAWLDGQLHALKNQNILISEKG